MPELDVHADFIVPAPPEPKIVTPPVTPPATPPVEGATPTAAELAAAAAKAAPVVAPPITFVDPPVVAAPTPPADTTVIYNKTGDAGLDVALQYVGARGFGPDHPAIVAAQKGDFAVLEAELAKLGDKAPGFAAYVELAKDSYGRRQTAAKAASDATSKIVYDAVGGAPQWAAIQTWAQENADPAEKAQLNAAFKAGGMVARAAAKELAALYKKAGNPAPKSVVKVDAGAHAPVAAGTLDGKQFGAATAALYAKLGNRMQESAEYAALVAQRRAHRG